MLSFCALCRGVLVEGQRQHALTSRFTESRERDLEALTRAAERMGVVPPGGGRAN